jgi:hypothetical protein
VTSNDCAADGTGFAQPRYRDDHGDAGSLGYGGEILMLAGWQTFTGQAEDSAVAGQRKLNQSNSNA